MGKPSMSLNRFLPANAPRPRRRFLRVRGIEAIRRDSLLDNAAIAELLLREVERASGYRAQAFRRAARAAFMCPQRSQ